MDMAAALYLPTWRNDTSAFSTSEPISRQSYPHFSPVIEQTGIKGVHLKDFRQHRYSAGVRDGSVQAFSAGTFWLVRVKPAGGRRCR